MAEKMFDIPTQLVLDKLASKHSFDEAAEEMQKSLDNVGVKLDLKSIRATLEEINNEMLRDIQKIKKANEDADRERALRYRNMQVEIQRLDEANAEHQSKLWAVYDKQRAKEYVEFLKDAEKGMAEYEKERKKDYVDTFQTAFAKPGGGMEVGGSVLTPRVGEVPIPKGGGAGSALGTGAVAGAAAAGVLLLAEVIQDAIKQSKIITMFLETVGKALGLLMDLILMPFLPLIMWVLIKLFEAIMWFGKLWNEGMKLIIENFAVFALSLLLLPLTITKAIIDWFNTWVLDPIIGSIDNWFPGFKQAWDDFWADPLAALKAAWTEFWTDPFAKLKEAWTKVWNDLYDWVAKSPIGRLLGMKTIEEQAEEEKRKKNEPKSMTLEGVLTSSTVNIQQVILEGGPGVKDEQILRNFIKSPNNQLRDPAFTPSMKTFDFAGEQEGQKETPKVEAKFTIQVNGTTTDEVKVIAEKAALDKVNETMSFLRRTNQTVGGI